MVNPVKTPLGAARAVTHASLHALRHPLQTVTDAAALGRGLVATVVTAERRVMGHRADPASGPALAEEAPPRKLHGDVLGDDATTPTTPTTPTTKDPATAPREPATTHVTEPATTHVTEPSPVTGPGDDEEIPDPGTPLEDDDVEVVTPVGTTGAGPGFNPDTTESDLQQPGTEPLMDPSTTKRIKKETETLRKAADPKK